MKAYLDGLMLKIFQLFETNLNYYSMSRVKEINSSL